METDQCLAYLKSAWMDSHVDEKKTMIIECRHKSLLCPTAELFLHIRRTPRAVSAFVTPLCVPPFCSDTSLYLPFRDETHYTRQSCRVRKVMTSLTLSCQMMHQTAICIPFASINILLELRNLITNIVMK